MSDVQTKAALPESIAVPFRRVLSLGLVAGYIDALGFIDLGGIYTAAMTGNTVQLGISFASEKWAHFTLVGATLAAFFGGALFSSFIRRLLPHPALELIIMAGLIGAAQLVHLFVPHPLAFELPLLAVSMAMQGETISRFGGQSIQTIVVTNNLVKFADSIIGRYVLFDANAKAPGRRGAQASRADVVLPGIAWFAYSLGAASGAYASFYLGLAFIPPVLLLLLTTADLLATPPVK